MWNMPLDIFSVQFQKLMIILHIVNKLVMDSLDFIDLDMNIYEIIF